MSISYQQHVDVHELEAVSRGRMWTEQGSKTLIFLWTSKLDDP